jgi:GT2 family glycosyltransferase
MSDILIQCVVVLYKCSLGESRTLQSLAEFCRLQRGPAQQIALLIYDNSQGAHPKSLASWNYGSVEYYQASRNDGLAIAYNHALSVARRANSEWLLLLDQDTEISPAFFASLFAIITSRLSPAICTIVPKLTQEGRVLSPQIVRKFRNDDCPPDFSGVCPKQVTAFNSAACMRVQSLIAIQGFANAYWLDYLDHITFHRLQATGGRVFILDITIKHRLSLHNLDSEMGLGRYANLLAAEWKFVRETGSGGGSLIHRLRLAKRSLTQAIKLRNRSYALKTLRSALDVRSTLP